MNNLKYFPYTRNQYYYGKLLTEQDFIQEQRYMNDKRRLHNRFLHGVGVAAGLRVVAVDEKSISVEDGVAVDFSGREIVVDIPAVRRLSTIDGYETVMEQGKGNLAYLCIEYEEFQDSPAHNVAVDRTGRETEFDQCREGYHLYLTDREPEQLDMALDHLKQKEDILYQDSRIIIRQSFPRSVCPGERFETVISVENRGNTVQLSVTLNEGLEGASFQESGVLKLEWKNLVLERGQKKEQHLELRSMELEQGRVLMTVLPEQAVVSLGREEYHPSAKKQMSVPIQKESRIQGMTDRFFNDAMEEAVRDNYPQGIYLARIALIRTEETYIIESIEPMPFQQYTYSAHLLAGIVSQLIEDSQKHEETKDRGPGRDRESRMGRESAETGKAQGVVRIPLGVGGKRGQRFISSEIYHGLGLGPVHLSLSIQHDDLFYSGSSEIFEDMEVKAELAARLDASRGAFVVGLRLIEPTSVQWVDVYWRAAADPAAQEETEREKHIYILPGKLELKVRESCYLEAVCENVPGATVLWNVTDPYGGSISSDGAYTAPNTAGVYEITAQCQDAPELKASLFVVVRE